MQLFERASAALQDLAAAAGAQEGKARRPGVSRGAPKLRDLALEYSWAEVERATGAFSKEFELGRGGSGTVYRGMLQEGTEVAVKVIEGQVGAGFKEEVRLLSRCRHPNVVMLLGFAREGDGAGKSNGDQCLVAKGRRALIYELLPGGDVVSRLYGLSAPPFPWQERLRTAIGAVRGLAHLHKHRPEVFHRDIKSANTLFGEGGVVKIADFGLACVSKHRCERERAVDIAAGTPGYADPLYALSNVVTEASEVYSMGMFLLELLTGRLPAAQSPQGFVFLVSELRPHEDGAKGRVLKRLDARAAWPLPTAASLATLALLCIHEDATRRPSFLDLAAILHDLAATASEAAAVVLGSLPHALHPTLAPRAVSWDGPAAAAARHQQQHHPHWQLQQQQQQAWASPCGSGASAPPPPLPPPLPPVQRRGLPPQLPQVFAMRPCRSPE
mmetsp:Transcript_93752/g.201269  ORF Transcript_93752/g.201269 Transcript_93752/m.201269 type:complete len:443 (-) Transcript_93752:153-1481(-)